MTDPDELSDEQRKEQDEENAQVLGVYELMRKHTKRELLAMAYRGGLADFNSPEKWTKQEIAVTVADQLRLRGRTTNPS